MRAGRRRTYFFDVRQTKGNDYYLTLTESTRKYNGDGYERHKIFLYKEDFNRFLASLEDTINHVKTELMPDYDYDEYTRKHEEWEAKRKAERLNEENNTDSTDEDDSQEESAESEEGSEQIADEDDMSW